MEEKLSHHGRIVVQQFGIHEIGYDFLDRLSTRLFPSGLKASKGDSLKNNVGFKI